MNPPKNCPLKKRRFQPAFVWVLGRGEKERWLQQQWWYTVNIQYIYIPNLSQHFMVIQWWYTQLHGDQHWSTNFDQQPRVRRNHPSVFILENGGISSFPFWVWIMLDHAGCWMLIPSKCIMTQRVFTTPMLAKPDFFAIPGACFHAIWSAPLRQFLQSFGQKTTTSCSPLPSGNLT